MGRQVMDMTGQRFVRWTVLSLAPRTGKGQSRWLCRCDCGTEKILLGDRLRNGLTRSCGCLKIEEHTARLTTHGHAGAGERRDPTYRSWSSMKNRCTNPVDPKYPDYGGRGIKVCQRWLDDYTAFLADMGQRPEGCTIERLNVHGNYEPGNCTWATPTTQARNRRNSRLIDFQGEKRTIAEVSEMTGIKQTTLSHRLGSGWSVESATSMPVGSRQSND